MEWVGQGVLKRECVIVIQLTRTFKDDKVFLVMKLGKILPDSFPHHTNLSNPHQADPFPETKSAPPRLIPQKPPTPSSLHNLLSSATLTPRPQPHDPTSLLILSFLLSEIHTCNKYPLFSFSFPSLLFFFFLSVV